jgi:hypothetical protein
MHKGQSWLVGDQKSHGSTIFHLVSQELNEPQCADIDNKLEF